MSKLRPHASEPVPAPEQTGALEVESQLIAIGKAYLFHTHLGIWLGRVVELDVSEVVLDECSWIFDQGRMSKCVIEGIWNNNEFVGNGVIVPRGGIVVPWRWPLPTTSR